MGNDVLSSTYDISLHNRRAIFVGEKNIGGRFVGGSFVRESFVGEQSVGKKLIDKKSVGEKFVLGEEDWVRLPLETTRVLTLRNDSRSSTAGFSISDSMVSDPREGDVRRAWRDLNEFRGSDMQ